MTHRGRDIWAYHVPRSGVSYSETFAWVEAARWRGLTDEQMADLDGHSQARVIAQWETHMQIEAVLAAELERKRRRRA